MFNDRSSGRRAVLKSSAAAIATGIGLSQQVGAASDDEWVIVGENNKISTNSQPPGLKPVPGGGSGKGVTAADSFDKSLAGAMSGGIIETSRWAGFGGGRNDKPNFMKFFELSGHAVSYDYDYNVIDRLQSTSQNVYLKNIDRGTNETFKFQRDNYSPDDTWVSGFGSSYYGSTKKDPGKKGVAFTIPLFVESATALAAAVNVPYVSGVIIAGSMFLGMVSSGGSRNQYTQFWDWGRDSRTSWWSRYRIKLDRDGSADFVYTDTVDVLGGSEMRAGIEKTFRAPDRDIKKSSFSSIAPDGASYDDVLYNTERDIAATTALNAYMHRNKAGLSEELFEDLYYDSAIYFFPDRGEVLVE